MSAHAAIRPEIPNPATDFAPFRADGQLSSLDGYGCRSRHGEEERTEEEEKDFHINESIHGDSLEAFVDREDFLRSVNSIVVNRSPVRKCLFSWIFGVFRDSYSYSCSLLAFPNRKATVTVTISF
jgi:hypothetical protein